MSTVELSIILVSYNTCEMTLEALRSARDETRTKHEIIVVDNASTDCSVKAIEAKFPDIRLMVETQNHGFARANNLAAREARGRYLLLLNPDTIVLDRALDRLIAFAKRRPEAGIWGGRTLFGDGALNPASCWGAMTLWSLFTTTTGLGVLFRNSPLFNTEGYGGWQRDSESAVDIVAGCLLLIERSLWERLGGFDETFNMYGEESDLCLRAHSLGAKPWITPEAQIIHHGGASETVRADKVVRLLKAKITLIRRHFPRFQRKLALLLFRAWPLSRITAYKALTLFFGASRYRFPRKVWREIWIRRSEWWNGYPANKRH